ncbi:MAG: 23S rRNA (guanosine(2251)-2'-O)-methyltransferase RlmB, partial [Bacilli bacterium]|nr:23S rRNA (guanosine(2251)-2'-O)-methyltransferase RlmB [Bacilli bacterium]
MSNFIYGTNVCIAAIESGYPIKNIYIEENNHRFISYVRSKTVPYVIVRKEQLNQVNELHQGVMMEIDSFKTYDLNDVIRKQETADFNRALLLILDGLEDPHNFGAVLRIADAAGVDGIIYRKTRSVKLNATVVRVSTGAAFYVKCVEAVNLTAAIKNLKSFGYWIVGAEAATESIDFRSIKYDMATALVIGSEGRGLSRLVKDNCDYLVQIPMFGHINSLNAA